MTIFDLVLNGLSPKSNYFIYLFIKKLASVYIFHSQ